MILLLGATGYIGQAFARELMRRQWVFRPLSRREVDYSRFETLLEFLLSNERRLVGEEKLEQCFEARIVHLPAGERAEGPLAAHQLSGKSLPDVTRGAKKQDHERANLRQASG